MKKLGTDQRLKKKLQEILDLTTAENAAIDNANNPSASNPFATMADVENVELGEDIVDALAGAGDPSSSNPFATISDIADLGLDSDELDAIESSNNPSTANPFATLADLPEGGGVIDVTYDELLALMDSSGDGLVPGQFYRITDFATSHNIYDYWTPLAEVHTEGIEPLIVFATSENTIAEQVWSEINPNDIIHYDVTNNLCEDTTTSRTGKITYRKDTERNIETYYDFRGVVFRRWKVWLDGFGYPLFSDENSYVFGDFVIYNDAVYYCIKDITDIDSGDTPETLTSNFSYFINSVDYLLHEGGNFYLNLGGNPLTGGSIMVYADPSEFKDFYTFSNSNGEEKSEWFKDISIGFEMYLGYNNIIFIETGADTTFSIKFDSNCSSITFGAANYYLTFGSGCYSMLIGNANYYLTFGYGCNGMLIGNDNYQIKFDDDCYFITIVDGNYNITCKYFNLGILIDVNNHDILFNDSVSAIMITASCYNIEFGAGCSNITIAESSYNVKIGQGSSYIELGDSSGGVNNIDIGQGCGGVGKDIVIEGLCKYITFGNGCRSITMATEAETLSFGNNCGYGNPINIGYLCWGISFGNGCSNIDIGQESGNISMGNWCEDIHIGRWAGNLSFEDGCMYITLPEQAWYNTFLSGCAVLKDFTDSSVVQLNDIHITHRRVGISKIVGTYLEEQSDGSFVEVHAEDIIGVS